MKEKKQWKKPSVENLSFDKTEGIDQYDGNTHVDFEQFCS